MFPLPWDPMLPSPWDPISPLPWDPILSQEWETGTINWATARAAAAHQALQNKVKVLLKDFHGASGVWDVVSLKLHMTTMIEQIRAEATAMVLAD